MLLLELGENAAARVRAAGELLGTSYDHPQRSIAEMRALYAPAFFSCMVISFQSTFMRSLSVIHRSACSWGGMSSQRFSMLARMGLEMAWLWRVCWRHVTAAARGTQRAWRVAVDGRSEAELRVARTTEERSMTAGGVESIAS